MTTAGTLIGERKLPRFTVSPSFLEQVTGEPADPPEFAKIHMPQNVMKTGRHATLGHPNLLDSYLNGFGQVSTKNSEGSVSQKEYLQQNDLHPASTNSELSLSSSIVRSKPSSLESQVEELVLCCWENPQQGEEGDIYEAVEPSPYTSPSKDNPDRPLKTLNATGFESSSDKDPPTNCEIESFLRNEIVDGLLDDRSDDEETSPKSDPCKRMDDMVGELTQKMFQVRVGNAQLLANLEESLYILNNLNTVMNARSYSKRDQAVQSDAVKLSTPKLSKPTPSHNDTGSQTKLLNGDSDMYVYLESPHLHPTTNSASFRMPTSRSLHDSLANGTFDSNDPQCSTSNNALQKTQRKMPLAFASNLFRASSKDGRPDPGRPPMQHYFRRSSRSHDRKVQVDTFAVNHNM